MISNMETETLFLYYINYRSQVVDILAMITIDNIEWIYMKCMQVIYRYFNINFFLLFFNGFLADNTKDTKNRRQRVD